MTGSELYFHDLSIFLRKTGHDVSILSSLEGGFLYKRAQQRGVKCFDFSQAPKMDFDIIIGSHRSVLEPFIKNKLYEGVPIISINHSEIIQEEYPVVDVRVKHYVAIRESIKRFLVDKYYIPEEDVSVIFNPINTDKLLSVKPYPPKRKTVVFPGTVDYLRKAAFGFMCKKALEEDFDFVMIGDKNSTEDYLPEIMNKNCKWYPASWEIQRYYAHATHTAGIQFGRTQIEGYFFGLPCYQFTVDKFGAITAMELVDPPKDLSKFEAKNVAKEIEQLCLKILG